MSERLTQGPTIATSLSEQLRDPTTGALGSAWPAHGDEYV